MDDLCAALCECQRLWLAKWNDSMQTWHTYMYM